jgi:hypothetical protein
MEYGLVDDLEAILTFVIESVWHVWPYFLLSVLLGQLMQTSKLSSAIRSTFSAPAGSSIALTAGLSAFSPFCSWTTIPVVKGLLLSGVPLAPVMVFWIASPTMDPEIFILSVAILGWPLALARLGATLILSIGAGYITLMLTRSGFLSQTLLCQQGVAVGYRAPTPVGIASANNIGTVRTTNRWWTLIVTGLREIHWRQVGREVVIQGWLLGRWLLLAFVLEALIIRYVPQTVITKLLGNDTPFAVPLAAIIGIPLYMGNTTALPIVSGLLEQGMQPGAAIAFLIAGPVTALPSMIAVWAVVARSVFALYLGIGLLGAIILGLLTNFLLA